MHIRSFHTLACYMNFSHFTLRWYNFHFFSTCMLLFCHRPNQARLRCERRVRETRAVSLLEKFLVCKLEIVRVSEKSETQTIWIVNNKYRRWMLGLRKDLKQVWLHRTSSTSKHNMCNWTNSTLQIGSNITERLNEQSTCAYKQSKAIIIRSIANNVIKSSWAVEHQ